MTFTDIKQESRGLRNFVLGLYPFTCLLFCACVLAAVIIVNNILFSLASFGLMVLIAAIAGKANKYLSAMLKTMFALILLMFLLQAFMYQGNSEILWQWKFISIKEAGVLHATHLSTTLLDISGSFALLFLLTDMKKLMRVFEEHGMPPKAAYVVLSTLQIIPEMSKRSKVIMDAQRSRGVETEGNLVIRTKAFLPMFIPLVLSSIISIEERALMLEARGFSYDIKKTYLSIPHDTKPDKMLRNIIVLITIGIVVARIALWIL